MAMEKELSAGREEITALKEHAESWAAGTRVDAEVPFTTRLTPLISLTPLTLLTHLTLHALMTLPKCSFLPAPRAMRNLTSWPCSGAVVGSARGTAARRGKRKTKR